MMKDLEGEIAVLMHYNYSVDIPIDDADTDSRRKSFTTYYLRMSVTTSMRLYFGKSATVLSQFEYKYLDNDGRTTQRSSRSREEQTCCIGRLTISERNIRI